MFATQSNWGGFPQLRVPFLGVPLTSTIIYRAVYIGASLFMETTNKRFNALEDVVHGVLEATTEERFRC